NSPVRNLLGPPTSSGLFLFSLLFQLVSIPGFRLLLSPCLYFAGLLVYLFSSSSTPQLLFYHLLFDNLDLRLTRAFALLQIFPFLSRVRGLPQYYFVHIERLPLFASQHYSGTLGANHLATFFFSFLYLFSSLQFNWLWESNIYRNCSSPNTVRIGWDRSKLQYQPYMRHKDFFLLSPSFRVPSVPPRTPTLEIKAACDVGRRKGSLASSASSSQAIVTRLWAVSCWFLSDVGVVTHVSDFGRSPLSAGGGCFGRAYHTLSTTTTTLSRPPLLSSPPPFSLPVLKSKRSPLV
ncbi:hypothetical protein IWZ01DRAFT_573169, partial [Phyllosticta capitalensis]